MSVVQVSICKIEIDAIPVTFVRSADNKLSVIAAASGLFDEGSFNTLRDSNPAMLAICQASILLTLDSKFNASVSNELIAPLSGVMKLFAEDEHAGCVIRPLEFIRDNIELFPWKQASIKEI